MTHPRVLDLHRILVLASLVASTACDNPAEVVDSGPSVDATAPDAPDASQCRTDDDGDGTISIACGGADCDDDDPDQYPGNVEICDATNHDEDCDPSTVGLQDVDGDGQTSSVCCNDDAEGVPQCGPDCDDTRAAVRPAALELCNELDDDCDGAVDETATVAMFVDADLDLHGDPSMPLMACAGAEGYAAAGDDCDDTTRAVYPGQLEICDGVDNDCNGAVDDATVDAPWFLDDDADGFGDPTSDEILSCVPIAGRSFLPFDCADSDPNRYPGADERCNARDDDCDGRADLRLGVNDYEDDDGDGVADISCGGTDCDDRDPAARPGAGERCNGRDDDCDGLRDEACGIPVDGGVADAGPMPTVDAGPRDAGQRDAGSDAGQDSGALDAGTTDAGPGCVIMGPEVCNGIDDDCGGAIDDGVCVPCPTGYSGFDADCTDNDECTLGTDACETVAMCENTPAGSYSCTCPSSDYRLVSPTYCAWSNAFAVTGIRVTIEGRTTTFEPGLANLEVARTATSADIEILVLPGFVGEIRIDGNLYTLGAPYTVPLVGGSNDLVLQMTPETFDTTASDVIRITRATTWLEELALHGANTTGTHQFGHAVSADGDTIVVAANREQGSSPGVNGPYNTLGGDFSGAAYVFERVAGVWTQTAYLKPARPQGITFGFQIAISGDIIAVSAQGDQTVGTGVGADPFALGTGAERFIGSVTTYYRGPDGWVYDQYIKASNAADRDNFGESLALSGNTLVVGAPSEDSIGTGVNSPTQSDNSRLEAGAAYVFVRSPGVAGTWTQQAYVKASNTQTDQFGSSVAISGDTLLVTAWREDSAIGGINVAGAQTNEGATDSGAVYVFTRSGGVWSQQAYVKAPTPEANAFFGRALAVDGDTMAIAESLSDVGALLNVGEVHVYTRSGSTWTLQETLNRPSPTQFDAFGAALALRGDTLLVGCSGDDSSQAGVSATVPSDAGFTDGGAVFVYQRSGGAWSVESFVKNRLLQQGFGNALAISANALGPYFVVGASSHNIDFTLFGGTAYLFR